MSSAFVKEGEARHLRDVAPNIGALLFFLRVENNGTVIRDEKNYFSEKHGRDVYEMSDGLIYALDDENHWYNPGIMKGQLFSGTNGLQIDQPKRDFPLEYSHLSRLGYYALQENSIEINSSFHKIPQAKTVFRWAAEVSPGFRFTP